MNAAALSDATFSEGASLPSTARPLSVTTSGNDGEQYAPVRVLNPSGPLTDAEIVAGVRAGDRAVFNALCIAYHDTLWRFAMTFLQHSEIAQDAVQDIFISLWERRAEVQFSGSVASYLFASTRKRSLVLLRNSRTTARITKSWADIEVPGHGQLPDSPGKVTERIDINSRIHQALEQLSPVRRQVITMRWVQQMEYDEIAQIMEMSQDAVRAHVSRAYRTLRDVLQSLGVDAPV